MRAKKGSQFERVVAAVLRVMDPGTRVRRGQWVQGPDGWRELDVLVEGTSDGQNRRVLVECKDFNPKITGPVGIAHVDALESKRRDLQVDVAIICSNAGFTADAVHKAARVGIGLVGVMRQGDKGIRFAVTEEIYTRKLQVEDLKISLLGPNPIDLNGVRFEDVRFRDVPVGNWVVRPAMLCIGSNPIVSGSYSATHRLRVPLEFTLPSGPVTVTQVNFHYRISGGWFAQQVTLDATHGLYVWLRHRVRLAPGPGQFLIKGVDIHAGQPISRRPDRELRGIKDVRPGEMAVALMLLSGLEPREPVPELDVHIEPQDLECSIANLPAEAYTSAGA